MDKNEKIKKYHLEEMTYVLLVLATDLSNYEDKQLIEFAEDIEGRIDVLFSYDFIIALEGILNVNKNVFSKIEKLKGAVVKLYSSGWHNKLKLISDEVLEIRGLAKEILDDLNFDYMEPIKYSESHLNIDW